MTFHQHLFKKDLFLRRRFESEKNALTRKIAVNTNAPFFVTESYLRYFSEICIGFLVFAEYFLSRRFGHSLDKRNNKTKLFPLLSPCDKYILKLKS